ncbi:hypothetical protein D1007_49069 [Hordeum vulgare]|nr:hypothetical protein D1007_49069 [Hordeum vulgare]
MRRQQWDERRPPPSPTSLTIYILTNIHGRLSLLDRLAFAAVFRAFKPEAPCLVLHLPGDDPDPETASLFSLAERRVQAVRAPGPQHAILGSSWYGCLVTADDRARLWLLNPVTGHQHLHVVVGTL